MKQVKAAYTVDQILLCYVEWEVKGAISVRQSQNEAPNPGNVRTHSVSNAEGKEESEAMEQGMAHIDRHEQTNVFGAQNLVGCENELHMV